MGSARNEDRTVTRTPSRAIRAGRGTGSSLCQCAHRSEAANPTRTQPRGRSAHTRSPRLHTSSDESPGQRLKRWATPDSPPGKVNLNFERSRQGAHWQPVTRARTFECSQALAKVQLVEVLVAGHVPTRACSASSSSRTIRRLLQSRYTSTTSTTSKAAKRRVARTRAN